MKRKVLKCPYCGAYAALRPASVVYGAATINREAHLYVCSRYPACDAYVGVNERDLTPLGTLADGNLRHKRIVAHRELDALMKRCHMGKYQAYKWLQAKLDLTEDQTHIALFSEYMCEKVIAVCRAAPGISRAA